MWFNLSYSEKPELKYPNRLNQRKNISLEVNLLVISYIHFRFDFPSCVFESEKNLYTTAIYISIFT